MAFATVWNYCVPLTVITVACLVRTDIPVHAMAASLFNVNIAVDVHAGKDVVDECSWLVDLDPFRRMLHAVDTPAGTPTVRCVFSPQLRCCTRTRTLVTPEQMTDFTSHLAPISSTLVFREKHELIPLFVSCHSNASNLPDSGTV
ncbi:hypothetical protein F2P81_002127 [Scophthalmus maximus]|uniref:Secreted protein n=1 Tax=Scophthalmus maximus TaxID=52904 RepID=A0A6A4TMG1_SCOMX|nr:hypothetical protein F2P81_002127 [Scophthalmus maximus]